MFKNKAFVLLKMTGYWEDSKMFCFYYFIFYFSKLLLFDCYFYISCFNLFKSQCFQSGNRLTRLFEQTIERLSLSFFQPNRTFAGHHLEPNCIIW